MNREFINTVRKTSTVPISSVKAYKIENVSAGNIKGVNRFSFSLRLGRKDSVDREALIRRASASIEAYQWRMDNLVKADYYSQVNEQWRKPKTMREAAIDEYQQNAMLQTDPARYYAGSLQDRLNSLADYLDRKYMTDVAAEIRKTAGKIGVDRLNDMQQEERVELFNALQYLSKYGYMSDDDYNYGMYLMYIYTQGCLISAFMNEQALEAGLAGLDRDTKLSVVRSLYETSKSSFGVDKDKFTDEILKDMGLKKGELLSFSKESAGKLLKAGGSIEATGARKNIASKMQELGLTDGNIRGDRYRTIELSKSRHKLVYDTLTGKYIESIYGRHERDPYEYNISSHRREY